MISPFGWRDGAPMVVIQCYATTPYQCDVTIHLWDTAWQRRHERLAKVR